MFIDHLGMSVVYELEQKYIPGAGADGVITPVMRLIGRIAFIIYAFLLTEGFVNTSNRPRYLLRLLAGAVISEIPFDLAGSRKWLDPWDQNIFFTLAIGFCTIWVLEIICGKRTDSPVSGRNDDIVGDENIKERGSAGKGRSVLYAVLGILTVLAGMALAELIRCDYGCMGVGLIVVFYLFRWRTGLFWAVMIEAYTGHLIVDYIYYIINRHRYFARIGQPYLAPDAATVLVNLVDWADKRLFWTMPGIFAAVLLILLYNGEKGRQLPKAFYYLFYPVHLLLLYLIVKNI